MAKRITQARLRKYLKLKNDVAEEKAAIERELGEGAKVESGDISASISTSNVTRPDWKGALLERCGEEALDDVIANTPPKETKKLLVRAKKRTIPQNKKKRKKTKEEIEKPLSPEAIAKLSMFGGQ
jgi:hypothetical protein